MNRKRTLVCIDGLGPGIKASTSASLVQAELRCKHGGGIAQCQVGGGLEHQGCRMFILCVSAGRFWIKRVLFLRRCIQYSSLL